MESSTSVQLSGARKQAVDEVNLLREILEAIREWIEHLAARALCLVGRGWTRLDPRDERREEELPDGTAIR